MIRATSLLLVLCLTAAAHADLAVSVEFGWEGKVRAGRWTPLFVTVADTAPRNVILDLYAPQDRHLASRIRQHVVAGPTPTTYALFVPLSFALDETSITVREARSPHRRIDTLFLEDRRGFDVFPPQQHFLNPGDVFAGISGASSTLRLLQQQLEQAEVVGGYLPPSRLPQVPQGYDALDLLILNQPDLVGIGPGSIGLDQQRAIVKWVRAGGILLLIPGPAPLPTSGPLIDILPARIGDGREVVVGPELLSEHGLPERFRRLTGRYIEPTGSAQIVPLLGDEAVACIGRFGMGQIIVLSFDASGLQFNAQQNGLGFWHSILDGVISLPDPDDPQRRNVWFGQADQRQVNAVQHAMDLTGTVPGVGSFGFSYIAIVLIGIMVLVGPVDWFVLKWIGRQPWTWVTTAGWVGLITAGAIFIGSLVRSGDLHFRTIGIVDQAGGATVAAVDFAGIYSPQTRYYELNTPPRGWWTTPTAEGYWSSGGMRTELTYHQDYESSQPEPMRINVWNLRFLKGEVIADGPPLVHAELQKGDNRITGSITNLGEQPLSDIVLRTGGGVFRVDSPPLEPGQTIEVQALPDPRSQLFELQEHEYRYTPWRETFPVGEAPDGPGYSWATDLAVERSRRIEKLLATHEDLVCLYARIDDAAPQVQITAGDAHEKHWQIVRALLPLAKE